MADNKSSSSDMEKEVNEQISTLKRKRQDDDNGCDIKRKKTMKNEDESDEKPKKKPSDLVNCIKWIKSEHFGPKKGRIENIPFSLLDYYFSKCPYSNDNSIHAKLAEHYIKKLMRPLLYTIQTKKVYKTDNNGDFIRDENDKRIPEYVKDKNTGDIKEKDGKPIQRTKRIRTNTGRTMGKCPDSTNPSMILACGFIDRWFLNSNGIVTITEEALKQFIMLPEYMKVDIVNILKKEQSDELRKYLYVPKIISNIRSESAQNELSNYGLKVNITNV